MKVAIIHDYLNQFGGAERVLTALLEIFPQAHIYTLLYSKKRTNGQFGNRVYKTSFLDFELVRNYHRPFIPLMPMATETMTIDYDYDLIISDSAGYAKGVTIRHRPGFSHNPFHISYCYTPLRYAWELDNYFRNPIFKTFFRSAFTYLKNWDYKAAQKPDKILAVSEFIAKKIKDYYGRQAEVVYPPVNHKNFYYDGDRDNDRRYYLAVGRLLHYKRFDLIVEAFRHLQLPLKIVGTGPEEKNLKRLAAGHPNIEFLKFVADDELRVLYRQTKALIFPQVEDFGLVAAEAGNCGTPVIAFKAGGALEIVQDGATGIFFENQEIGDLIAAVRKFELLKFDYAKISALSKKFSKENFRRNILAQIPRKALENIKD